MLSDLRFAIRQLVKAPVFTIVAVLTLAIGIAATTSLFTVVKGLLSDPLPYPNSQQLVQVWTKDREQMFSYSPLSNGTFFDLKDRASSFATIGAFSVERFNIGGDRPEAVEGALCTPGVFEALNVQPLHGRWFNHDDEAGNSTAAVILSHALWQQRFASDPNCIGHSMRIDGRDYIIVGVMPPQFALLTAGTRQRPLAFWTLLSLRPDARDRSGWWLGSVARLKPGITLAQATEDVRRVAEDVKKSMPDVDPRRTFWLMPLGREIGGIPALRISVLLSAGWALLALAAHNVAGMMLARGISRQTEIAVRLALGASRWRIVRQLLTESLLLSLMAAGCGLILSLWCIDALAVHLPVEVMPRSGLAPNSSTVGCIVVLIFVVNQMVGLTPALLASKTDVVTSLKESGGGSSGQRTQRKLRRLVVGQIAIALLLVSVAMQLSSSYRAMLASSRALRSEEIVTTGISMRGPSYNGATQSALCERLIENVSALPGVREAGVTSQLPFNGGYSTTVLIDDEPFDRDQRQHWVQSTLVSARTFPALSVTLLRGRLLTKDDERTNNHVVVINQAMAQQYWPGQNPLGHRIRPEQANATTTDEVVGVISDLAQNAERLHQPEIYFPFGLAPREDFFLVIRMAPGTRAPIEAIRDELHRLDPDLAMTQFRTMTSLFDEQSRVFTTITSLVDIMTTAILGLAALGLYGTLSFHFTRRRREIGVRVALGASSQDIVVLVFRQALVWVTAGAALGVVGAWLLGRAVSHMLEGANPSSITSLSLSVLLVFLAAILGAWLPARRATRINPIEALRAE
jgi:putative ABC transport system permease protein